MTDEELLYLFIVIKNQWAFDYLYQKYQNLINILTRKKFYQFFTLPLELNDLQSINYFLFYQSILTFQSKKNKSFKNFFLINLNWGLLKYFKKYLTKNHQILNMAVEYHDYFVSSSLSFQENFYQNNFLEYFIYDNLKLTVYEKNVLELKYQGYSNHEIMKILSLNYKQVDNALQRVNLKLKKID